MTKRFPSDARDDRPFWQQRTWQFSAAFFAFMVCAGVVIALSGGSDSTAGAGQPARTGPLSGAAGSATSRPDGCRTDDADQSTPVRPPDDVRWQPLNGGEIPISASVGPLRTSDPVLWCFAHTPMGAVMAAHVIPRQLSGDDWRTVTDQQVVAGVGRDLFEAMRASVPENQAPQPPSSLAGFTLVSYVPATATVRLLLRRGALLGATNYTVKWDGGDWKVLPSSVGDLYTEVTAVSTTAGFVMWKV